MSANSGMGPTLIIWCTIGVSGSRAPAIRAMRGLQTPQQITQIPVSMSPAVVRTARTAGTLPASAVSMPSTSVPGQHPQRAGLLGLLPHEGAGPQRVDHAHGREVRPAQDHRLIQVRHQLADLGG